MKVLDIRSIPQAAHPADGVVQGCACRVCAHIADTYVVPCPAVYRICAGTFGPCRQHPTACGGEGAIGRAAFAITGCEDPVGMPLVGRAVV